VWKEVRGELSGAELSDLDLSRVVLNGTQCSRFYKSDYLAANFNGSLLHEMCIFPQGHFDFINSAICSVDGKKILSASSDYTIKEWDVASGQCLKTYKGTYVDLIMSEGNLGSAGKKILPEGNKIEMIDGKTIINIPGLFIHGCSFKNLHPDSDLSKESKNRLRQYGAVI
jgi:WD40 repeat protein